MTLEKNTKDISSDSIGVEESILYLEELATQALLVDLIDFEKAEVFEGIVFDGKRRYYIENLTIRDYTLEHVTPYQFEIDNFVIETGTWGVLIARLAAFLLKKFPEYSLSILQFQCPWSRQYMFCNVPKTNYRMVQDGLYVNCNHTALHSCWFIQDLLDFFDVDKKAVKFLVHRPSGAEPQRVKDYIEKRFKRDFILFMSIRFGKSEEYAQKTLYYIDKYLNKMLTSISKSYTSFYLFDSNTLLSSYASKVRDVINADSNLPDNGKKSLNRCIDYIQEYYRS